MIEKVKEEVSRLVKILKRDQSLDGAWRYCAESGVLTDAYMMQGRTSFIIAHRLNTIRDADTIMVIDGGQIVEQGNHDQLMSRQGYYYTMFYNQFKNIVED